MFTIHVHVRPERMLPAGEPVLNHTQHQGRPEAADRRTRRLQEVNLTIVRQHVVTIVTLTMRRQERTVLLRERHRHQVTVLLPEVTALRLVAEAAVEHHALLQGDQDNLAIQNVLMN